MNNRVLAGLVLALALATACESDGAKLQRLTDERLRLVLEELYAKEKGIPDSIAAVERRILLNRREYNKFMSGR